MDEKEKTKEEFSDKLNIESMVGSMVEGVIMIDERDEIVVLNPQAKRMLGFRLAEKVTSKELNEKFKAVKLDKSIEECYSTKLVVTKEVVISREENQPLRLNGSGLTESLSRKLFQIFRKTTDTLDAAEPKGRPKLKDINAVTVVSDKAKQIEREAKSQFLHCSIAPVRNKNQEAAGVVIILRDITKEKEVDRMKTEFISTVSHELRTPLTTMKEFVSILADEIPGKLSGEQKEYIGIVKGNIDRLARLINDLLDISKIEAGKVGLKRTLVDISNLANSVISSLLVKADEKHIRFNALFHSPLPDVYIDPDKIIQVFTNLVGNAVKFTPENGEITIEITDKLQEIECSITDSGAGINHDDFDKLFTRFQQFDRVAGAGAKGTGLGLAISKELVQMHNGRIWADSEFSQGSKFIFTLPKLSAKFILEEYVDSGIKEAMDKGGRFSIIVISLGNFQEAIKQFEEKVVHRLLMDIEEITKKTLRRLTDIAIRSTGEIVALLVDIEREGAFNIKNRLESAIKEYILNRKDLADKLQINLGTATFPDEARSSEELITRAKNQLELIYTGPERRKTERKKIELKIGFSAEQKDKIAELDYVTSRDLSEDGIGLFTKEELKPGTKLFISIQVPPQKTCLEIEGEVIWSKKLLKDGEYVYRTGVKLCPKKS